jgi:hypothetical protein
MPSTYSRLDNEGLTRAYVAAPDWMINLRGTLMKHGLSEEAATQLSAQYVRGLITQDELLQHIAAEGPSGSMEEVVEETNWSIPSLADNIVIQRRYDHGVDVSYRVFAGELEVEVTRIRMFGETRVYVNWTAYGALSSEEALLYAWLLNAAAELAATLE